MKHESTVPFSVAKHAPDLDLLHPLEASLHGSEGGASGAAHGGGDGGGGVAAGGGGGASGRGGGGGGDADVSTAGNAAVVFPFFINEFAYYEKGISMMLSRKAKRAIVVHRGAPKQLALRQLQLRARAEER
jgi:hypothetical protein